MELPINKIINGDSLEVLKTIPDESIDCCISSPPYWSLRNYDVEGQLGLEPDFNEYIKKLCDIYDEVFRVLKKSGTCWVNLGDTYYGGGNNRGSTEENLSEKQLSNRGARGQVQVKWDKSYPTKSLCLIPERFVIEMINRGWILRNRIVWYKRNSMPSSVKDRFANKWEYVFFFVKNKKYYFDLDSVRKPHKISSVNRINAGFSDKVSFNYRVREACKVPLQAKFGEMYKANPKEIEKYGSPRDREYRKGRKSNNSDLKNRNFLDYNSKYPNQQLANKKELRDSGVPYDLANCNPKGGNPGDFWDITTKGHPFAHFAVYPESLCEVPIKSGCPEFVCNNCGEVKEVKEVKEVVHNRINNRIDAKVRPDNLERIPNDWKPREVLGTEIISCNCNAGFSGGIVLDPFIGSGTTGIVALKLGRQFIGIELNKEYIKIAEERIKPYLQQTKL